MVPIWDPGQTLPPLRRMIFRLPRLTAARVDPMA
jgi:hypothetical protein